MDAPGQVVPPVPDEVARRPVSGALAFNVPAGRELVREDRPAAPIPGERNNRGVLADRPDDDESVVLAAADGPAAVGSPLSDDPWSKGAAQRSRGGCGQPPVE